MRLRSLFALPPLGPLLRPRAHELRGQLATARLIAETSTSMINCGSGGAACVIERMLARLGRQLGMARAYLVLDGAPERSTLWQEDGVGCPPGWPVHALWLYL